MPPGVVACVGGTNWFAGCEGCGVDRREFAHRRFFGSGGGKRGEDDVLDSHLGEECEEEPDPDHVLPPDGDVAGGGEIGEQLSNSVANETIVIPRLGVSGDSGGFEDVAADSEDEEEVEGGEVLPGGCDGIGTAVQLAGFGIGDGLAFGFGEVVATFESPEDADDKEEAEGVEDCFVGEVIRAFVPVRDSDD